jgi:hypothetical protein
MTTKRRLLASGLAAVCHWVVDLAEVRAFDAILWRRAEPADWADEETGESLLNGLRPSCRTRCVSLPRMVLVFRSDLCLQHRPTSSRMEPKVSTPWGYYGAQWFRGQQVAGGTP